MHLRFFYVLSSVTHSQSADFYSKITFLKKYFKNTIRVSNGLGPDQDRHVVGPDLGPNC